MLAVPFVCGIRALFSAASCPLALWYCADCVVSCVSGGLDVTRCTRSVLRGSMILLSVLPATTKDQGYFQIKNEQPTHNSTQQPTLWATLPGLLLWCNGWGVHNHTLPWVGSLPFTAKWLLHHRLNPNVVHFQMTKTRQHLSLPIQFNICTFYVLTVLVRWG